MTMMMMYGNVGYGKNIFAVDWARTMVKIGQKRREQWESFNQEQRRRVFKDIPPSEVRVMSNFHIEDQTTHEPLPQIKFMTIDEFLALQGEVGIQYHLEIDEPYAWGLESRRSGSDMAIEMTKKSLQSRKTGAKSETGQKSGSDIFGFTQLPSSVDKRLKYLARSIILAMTPDDFGYHYLYMGKIYRVLHISMVKAKRDIFPYYDTYEKIETTFSQEFMESAGIMDAGRKEDAIQIEQSIRKVQNDYSMVTKDGIRIWHSLVRQDIWDEALKEGGKVEQAS